MRSSMTCPPWWFTIQSYSNIMKEKKNLISTIYVYLIQVNVKTVNTTMLYSKLECTPYS